MTQYKYGKVHTYVSTLFENFKTIRKILQIFVAFSEKLNLNEVYAKKMLVKS